MREIKFRAWNHLTKEMDYGKSVLVDFYQLNSSYDHRLMQYTGLKDKNGVEIYEGDIVDIFGTKDSVVFSLGSFDLFNYEDEYGHGAPFQLWDECEVIGNIYENLELLS